MNMNATASPTKFIDVLPSPSIEAVAKSVLERSKSEKLIGRVVTYGRKGGAHTKSVICANGIFLIDGETVNISFDKIVSIRWERAEA